MRLLCRPLQIISTVKAQTSSCLLLIYKALAEVWETGTLSSSTKACGGDRGEAREDETGVWKQHTLNSF